MNSEKQQYIITQDTFGIYEKISNSKIRVPRNSINVYTSEVEQTIKTNLDPLAEISVRVIKENDINQKLGQLVKTELSNDPDSICICLDRFLLPELENNPDFKSRFFRFGISRKSNGDKVSRQGYSSFEKQLTDITSEISDIKNKKIIFADDGFFSGSTIKTVQKIFNSIGIKNENTKVIGYIGNNSAIENNDNFKVIESITNLYDWVDLRDFSIFGGRLINSSKNNKVSISEPYIYPWSNGEAASLDNQNLFEISEKLIESQIKMILEWEKSLDKKIEFKDLVKAGFSLPYNRNKSVPININMEVIPYLDSCLEKVNFEKNRQIYIFDMDGTLYQLDGQNNGYSGSSLENKVNKNIIQFIIERELCSIDNAQEIFNQAISDPVGASQYLSNRYQITRTEYFNTVWNIDPKDIVKNYNYAREIIPNINPKTKLILLTSSPEIWAKKVLSFLNINQKFEEIITGENYKTKSEVFEKFSKLYLNSNITTIGDQYETDIKPTEKFGFKSLLIQEPKDINKLSL